MVPQIIGVVTELLPEIFAFIKGFHTASGNFPTDDQVIQGLQIDAARITAKSDAWLASHPPTTT